MTRARSHIPKLARQWVTVGIILRPFGRNGEMKVRLETDFPERFQPGARFYLWKPPQPQGAEEPELERNRRGKVKPRTEKPQECFVENARWIQDTLILSLNGVHTIDDAEELRGMWLMVPPEERVPLPENEYYISDLIGLTVVTEAGEKVGLLKRVIPTAAYDLYEAGKHLIPARKEFILKVDLEKGRITVRLPEAEE
ncbi:MAG: 16S rRNA processing protein RimM [Fimbriimonadia bacterium]|nr:16S rRNA processing protein RimM [Fimbriimonadia bacterium]